MEEDQLKKRKPNEEGSSSYSKKTKETSNGQACVYHSFIPLTRCKLAEEKLQELLAQPSTSTQSMQISANYIYDGPSCSGLQFPKHSEGKNSEISSSSRITAKQIEEPVPGTSGLRNRPKSKACVKKSAIKYQKEKDTSESPNETSHDEAYNSSEEDSGVYSKLDAYACVARFRRRLEAGDFGPMSESQLRGNDQEGKVDYTLIKRLVKKTFANIVESSSSDWRDLEYEGELQLEDSSDSFIRGLSNQDVQFAKDMMRKFLCSQNK